MEYVKWSAKAIWAFIAPLVVILINDNREWLENEIAAIVAAAVTALLVWFQKNAAKPT